MGVQIIRDMVVLADDQDLSCSGKVVNLATEVAALDTTAVCTTTNHVTLIGGLKSGTIDLELMADFAEGHDSAIWSELGGSVIHSVGFGSADGSLAYTFRGIPVSYTPFEGSVGDLAMARMSGSSASSPVVRGALVHPVTARTSSGSGTGRQIGAVQAGKAMYAALHIVAASGTSPTLDVKVQSDDNAGFASPTDRITFTQATGTGAQFDSVAGAITDDYWRIVYTIGGTTPSFTFAAVIGFI